MDYINQMEPVFGEEEKNALIEYFNSGGWGTEYSRTREFENCIKEYTGAKHCWIMPNGTLSLTCALVSLGVSNNDEVIVPDYTMVATPNAVHLIGARAVFVDIRRDTLCMDFEKMKAAITKKTKAVILVSINGRCPSNMLELVDFCKQRGIYLIEDAAQSLGSRYGGVHLGRFGDIGSFSFSMPKIITTGQGGALITDDDEISERIRHIRDFGRDSGGVDHYLTMGWNLKFTDFQAVIGIEQMKKLPYRVERKKEMGRIYKNYLKDIPFVETISTDYEEVPPWFIEILCDDRDGLSQHLKGLGIGTRPFYPPLHTEPVFGYKAEYPVTEEISRKGLWLPSSFKVTNQQIKYICDSIKEYYE